MEIQGDYLPGKDLGRFIMIGPIPMGTISDGSLSRWLRDVAMYWPYNPGSDEAIPWQDQAHAAVQWLYYWDTWFCGRIFNLLLTRCWKRRSAQGASQLRRNSHNMEPCDLATKPPNSLQVAYFVSSRELD